MTIRGSLDVVTTKSASGWAYAPSRRSDIVVQAVLSHEVIGDATASDHRPDLAAVGMGKGNCGYTIEFYREINPLYLPFVSVKVDGGDIELPRAGQLGFADFFTAIHALHPTAGRSRSVLGGLWTDRTDAAAIVKSKAEIGQIDADTAVTIGQLIHLGIAVVERPGDPLATAGRDLEQIADLVETPSILAALRAAFDGNPAVLSAEHCDRDTLLVQPSAENRLPSAAECLVLVAAATEQPAAVEIVRDSHRLPEFTRGGVSRWANGELQAGVEVAAARQGLMSRYDIARGAVALIGPGTIYRLRCTTGAQALKMYCVPTRTIPMTLVNDDSRPETIRKSGVRLYT